MFSIYDGYSEIKKDNVSSFAGANTGKGFVGVYPTVADEEKLQHLYIIKGSAGCGKSTFMKKAAEESEKNGYTVEYYYCSSDPESLDCVVIDKRIAILDGTAPHVKEMTFPGAVSEILDLSHFLLTDKLKNKKKEIIDHVNGKKEYYSSAYSYIRAAELIEAERRKLSDYLLDKEKCQKQIERLISKLKLKSDNDYKETKKYSHALSMRGAYRITPANDSEEIYVTDSFGLAPIYMEMLHSELKKHIISHDVCLLPVYETIASIEITRSNLRFTVNNSPDNKNVINTERFLIKENLSEARGKIRLSSKIENECIDDALKMLSYAGKEHFELEKMYISSMDFDLLEKFRTTKITEIMNLLKKEK